MLVLTRKLHQVIVVGDHTLVTFIGYHAATGTYTFSIADERTEEARAVQLRVEESTVVADRVVMKLLGRKSAQARIGFNAPSNISIDRLEVRQA